MEKDLGSEKTVLEAAAAGAHREAAGRDGGGVKVALLAADVEKRFGATRALRGMDLEVLEGEVHGLVGANGAGKSTLVKLLSGAISADVGELGVEEWRGTSLRPKQAQALGLATIYQEPSLVPTLGVGDNIVLGREQARGRVILPRDRQRQEVEAVLGRVGLQVGPRRRVEALKPAEQQLLEIAKALHRGARVLIMDEPTATLGPEEAQRLFEVIRALRSERVAVLYISHRLEEVLDICDRISVIRDGRRVETTTATSTSEDRMVRAMIGRSIKQATPQESSRDRVALELRSIGQGRRLTDISFRVQEGEVVGITGLVGAGRSRLAHVLFGDQRPDRGEMELFGEEYRPRSPADAISRGVGLVAEDRKRDALLLQMSTSENITFARMPVRPLGVIRWRAERRIAKDLIGRLDVEPRSPRARVRNLSGGNQQKISIAKWLHAEARLLIFDEPGQGVDIGAKEHILAEIQRLAGEGRAVIVISSELEELAQVANRILVMRGGRISAELTHDELNEHRVLEASVGVGSRERGRAAKGSCNRSQESL